MQKLVLILTVLCTTSKLCAQIYTPGGIIQGASSNNNIGIGTATPGTKLYVEGDVSIGFSNRAGALPLRIRGLGLASGALYGSYGAIMLHSDNDYTASARRYLITNALNANCFGIIRSTDATSDAILGPAGVVLGGTADFVITNSGNIGIGNSNPGAKFEVSSDGISFTYPYIGYGKGSIHINPVLGTGDNTTSITFGANAGSVVNSGQAGIYVQSSGAYGTKMFFGTTDSYATGSQARMVIRENGNVGIGTITPLNRFSVVDNINISGGPPNGTTPSKGMLIGASSTTGILNLGVDASGAVFYSWLQSRSNNSSTYFNLALNPYGGNVGIGTTNPQYQFDIRKSSAGGVIDSRIINEDNTNSSSGARHIISTGGSSSGDPRTVYAIYAVKEWSLGIKNNNNDAFYISTNSDLSEPKLVVSTNGNVGIGTTSQGDYKLNVWGRIRAHEVVVNTTGADFVFANDYKLPNLSEVELFIKKNKHLPDIIPASEMKVNGMNLSEMQTKLLQKLEEMTLYIIEQNKVNEMQSCEIEKLKKQIETLTISDIN